MDLRFLFWKLCYFFSFFFESEFNTTRVTAAHAMGNDILESSSN